MKKRLNLKKHIVSMLGLVTAFMMAVPCTAFAAETGTSEIGTPESEVGAPASDSTDIKILDTMPMIWTDSDLNAALAVLDMSTGEPVDLNNQTVPSGTVLTYVIAYRNDNETTENVHLQIPVLDDYPLRSSYQGNYVGTLVNWDNVAVEPGQTVTRYITCDTPHATGMLPNTGLVEISDGKTLQTNTVNVAVSAPATVVEQEAPKPVQDQGVLGAFRRALKAAEDSPAVLGMRRAVQTGDVGYMIPRFAILGAICVALASLIVFLFGRKKESRRG